MGSRKITYTTTEAAEWWEYRRKHALDEAIRVATSSSNVSHDAADIVKAAKAFETYLATEKVK